MAASMSPKIANKMKYFLARFGGMYPLYLVACLLGFVNLLISCRPSIFSENFHMDAQMDDLYVYTTNLTTNLTTTNYAITPLFCEGTPAIQKSYYGNLFATLAVYLTGLQATPAWTFSWMLGFYLWFSSMFYQCLMIFPVLYNVLLAKRGDKKALWTWCIGSLVWNLALMLVLWFAVKDHSQGYAHFNKTTGMKMDEFHDATKEAKLNNGVILSWYLFGPFWWQYFVAGASAAFLYDAYRPAEQHSAWVWGYVADGITLIMLGVSIAHIMQGKRPHGGGLEENNRMDQLSLDPLWMRPKEGDTFVDNLSVGRIWVRLRHFLSMNCSTR